MKANRELSPSKYLPAVHHLRDAQQGGALDALLRVIDEQSQHVSEQVRQMYEDCFIETCRPEFVAYIGEMVGGTASSNLSPEDAFSGTSRALSMIFPRREAADAVSLQRRKGTLLVLEELAIAVAGWHARAQQWYPRVAQFLDVRRLPLPSSGSHSGRQARKTQTSLQNRKLLSLGATLDVRSLSETDDDAEQPAQGAYLSDLKPSRSDFYPKNSKLLQLHVYRLKPYRITQGRLKCIRSIPLACGARQLRLYTFDSAGICRSLFINPEAETAPSEGDAREICPTRLTRRRLEDPNRYYGRARSFELWEEHSTGEKARREFVSRDRMIVHDLSSLLDCGKAACSCTGKDGRSSAESHPTAQRLADALKAATDSRDSGKIAPKFAVDPESGLLALIQDSDAGDASPNVLATFHYGFSADMGGGEYSRSRPTVSEAPSKQIRVRRCRKDRQDGDNLVALAGTILQQAAHEPNLPGICRIAAGSRAVIEIADSDSYRLPTQVIEVPRRTSLEIRAAKRCYPTLQLAEDPPLPAVTFKLHAGASVTLEGLKIFGGRIKFCFADHNEPTQEASPCECSCLPPPAPTPRISIRHCTLVPGKRCHACSETTKATTIENAVADSVLTIDRCITSNILLHSQPEVNRLLIRDSIIDGQSTEGCAICGSDSTILRIERSTVLGRTSVREIDLAQDTIFSRPVVAARLQPGGMRFCFVPPNSDKPTWETPQQYYCQPSQTYERLNLGNPACRPLENQPIQADAEHRDVVHKDPWQDIQLSFTSRCYGDAGYGQLMIRGVIPSMRPNVQPCGRALRPAQTPCDESICCGAESGSEMGAMHDLYQAQREANLRRRVEEFTPMGMTAEIRFVN